jgi:hypothetical protein
MVETIKNTATDYEHMLDFVAEENINKGSLQEFIGEKEEYKQRMPIFPKNGNIYMSILNAWKIMLCLWKK